MKKSIPTIREREGNEKKTMPINQERKGNEQKAFPKFGKGVKKSIPIIREREFPLIPVTITHNTLPRYPWKERKQNIQSKTLKISKMVVRRSHHYPQYIAETSLQREKNIQLLLKKWRLFQQL